MSVNIVVIGAGQAAASFAAKMRELDSECTITIIGEEPSLPYQRPPLSKKYMVGEVSPDRLLLRPAEWYAENRIICLSDCAVTSVSTGDKTVELDNGEVLPFDKLLFATGSTPRRLPPPVGDDVPGIHYLRNMQDADAIAAELQSGRRLLVVGGGYIGLEVAAVAAGMGVEVTVTETADRILKRVASAETAEYFRNLHRKNGVDIREALTLHEISAGDNGAKRAQFADGTTLETDFVLVGIGAAPNDMLAFRAGLQCDDGIVVDASTHTSHWDIHAAGDCARFGFGGHQIRLESVQNAIDQAEAAAHAMAGEPFHYEPVPWFWSDQYDCKLQIAGLNLGYDQTMVRPGRREGSQSVWYFAGPDFVAVDAMNDPRAYMVGKKLLENGANVTPEQVGDPALDLSELLE